MPNNTNDLHQALDDMAAANAKAKAFLEKTSEEIAELDLQYAKRLVKDDISTLETAKSILSRQKD